MDMKPTTWTDAAGREWDCKIDFATLTALENSGLPVANLEQHLQELLMGSSLAITWIVAVVRDQAEDHGVSRDELPNLVFERFGYAVEAFLNAMQNFFPKVSQQRAEIFRLALATVDQEIITAMEKLQTGENVVFN
jgi:phage terminase Nu1 subunit (DNA packaging protein)